MISTQVRESQASNLKQKIMKQDYATQIFCYFLAPKKLPSSEDMHGPSSEAQILVAADTQNRCSNALIVPLDKKLVLFLFSKGLDSSRHATILKNNTTFF